MKFTYTAKALLLRSAFCLLLALGIWVVSESTRASDGRLVGGRIDVKAFEAKAAPIPTTQCPAMLAYIANLDSNDVSVIDTSNDTVLATVPVGSSPFGVAVKPDGTRVYVTNDSDNTVSVIDTSNNTVVATEGVGLEPAGVAVNPDGTRAYVTNSNSADSTLSVIDLPTTQWWPQCRWDSLRLAWQ